MRFLALSPGRFWPNLALVSKDFSKVMPLQVKLNIQSRSKQNTTKTTYRDTSIWPRIVRIVVTTQYLIHLALYVPPVKKPGTLPEGIVNCASHSSDDVQVGMSTAHVPRVTLAAVHTNCLASCDPHHPTSLTLALQRLQQ